MSDWLSLPIFSFPSTCGQRAMVVTTLDEDEMQVSYMTEPHPIPFTRDRSRISTTSFCKGGKSMPTRVKPMTLYLLLYRNKFLHCWY